MALRTLTQIKRHSSLSRSQTTEDRRDLGRTRPEEIRVPARESKKRPELHRQFPDSKRQQQLCLFIYRDTIFKMEYQFDTCRLRHKLEASSSFFLLNNPYEFLI